MRRNTSQAWAEIGYVDPAQVNDELTRARQRDRREHLQRKEEHDALPVRRVEARQLFAKIHAVVEGGEC